MNYYPRTPIGACPCGRQPEPKFKHLLSRKVRMECECGVSGQWQDDVASTPWHSAVRGWQYQGTPSSSPPMPRR